jgi:hypothetical protein
MKNEHWFRELTDLEVQNINGGRNGDGADRVREEKAMAQQQKAMKDAADFAKNITPMLAVQASRYNIPKRDAGISVWESEPQQALSQPPPVLELVQLV